MKIKVLNVTKKLNHKKILDQVSISIKSPKIVGLLGPNGAGKTTLIESMVGLKKIDEGEIEILGLSPLPKNRKFFFKKIGIQYQEAKMEKNLKVKEVLNLFSSFYKDVFSLEYLINQLELGHLLNQYCGKLSFGQYQKVLLTLAFINNPEIVFLDEFTIGLDPLTRKKIWNFILKMKQLKKIIFFSTHTVEEAKKYCDEIIFLNQGKVKFQGSYENLLSFYSKNSFKIFFKNKINQKLFKDFDYIDEFDEFESNDQSVIITCFKKRNTIFIKDFLKKKGLFVSKIEKYHPKIEDLYNLN